MNFRTLSVSKNEGIVTAAKEKRDKESAAVQPSPPTTKSETTIIKKHLKTGCIIIESLKRK